VERFLTVNRWPVIRCAREGHRTMPRTTNRSPRERALLNRRIFVGGALVEIAAGIALLFLLSWPTNIILVGSAAVILIGYDVMFWQSLKKQAADQRRDNTSEQP
jgi:heme O synthase-like polyprenyltransferase